MQDRFCVFVVVCWVLRQVWVESITCESVVVWSLKSVVTQALALCPGHWEGVPFSVRSKATLHVLARPLLNAHPTDPKLTRRRILARLPGPGDPPWWPIFYLSASLPRRQMNILGSVIIIAVCSQFISDKESCLVLKHQNRRYLLTAMRIYLHACNWL